MASLNSLMYQSLAAFGRVSSSLSGRSEALNPLRLFLLDKTSTIVAQSQTLFWDTFEALGVAWGDSTTLRYAEPETGWTYVWNVSTGVFVVTDAVGVATAYTDVTTISGLGVSWAVLESAQFSLMINAVSTTDTTTVLAFPRGLKANRSRAGAKQAYDHNSSAYLAIGTQHAIFNRLSYSGYSGNSDYTADDGTVEITTNTAFLGDILVFSILLSEAGGLLQATVPRSHYLQGGGSSHEGTRTRADKASLMVSSYSYLMIALFAQSKLSAGESRIVYEPWMLYEIFRWYFNVTRITTVDRRIFDLSPRW